MKSINISLLLCWALVTALAGCTTGQPREAFDRPEWVDIEDGSSAEQQADSTRDNTEQPASPKQEKADSLVEALFNIEIFDEEKKKQEEAAAKQAAEEQARNKAAQSSAEEKEPQAPSQGTTGVSEEAGQMAQEDSDEYIPSIDLDEEENAKATESSSPQSDSTELADTDAPVEASPPAEQSTSSILDWAKQMLFGGYDEETSAQTEEQPTSEATTAEQQVPEQQSDTSAAQITAHEASTDAQIKTDSTPPKPPIPKPKPLTALSSEQAGQAEAAQKYFEMALAKFKAGDEEAALRLFKDISAQYPLLTGPKVNQAIILRKQGKLNAAKDLLQDILFQKTSSYYVLNELGVTYRYLGQFAQARQAYESAIRKEPAYDKPYYNLGILADLYLQDLQLALDSFKKYQALQTEPDKRVAGWIVEIERRMK